MPALVDSLGEERGSSFIALKSEDDHVRIRKLGPASGKLYPYATDTKPRDLVMTTKTAGYANMWATLGARFFSAAAQSQDVCSGTDVIAGTALMADPINATTIYAADGGSSGLMLLAILILLAGPRWPATLATFTNPTRKQGW